MDWSESDLRAGLEAGERADKDSDAGFHPVDVEGGVALDLLQELVRRGWVLVDSPLRGDGRLVAAHGVRLTSTGRAELSQWRQAAVRPGEALPTTPLEAWNKLQEQAEPFSPFARAIEAAMGDLETRGMFQSGPSIRRAMEVAYDHDLTWSASDEAFVARPRPQGSETSQPMTVGNPDTRTVFVVYGRDGVAKAALFNFLRALDLVPLEWEQVVALTGAGSPYIGDVLVRGFREAQAAVVLFTPDDEARLHADLRGAHEPVHETQLTCQPRPNVLIEAGMALAFQPDRTIIVQVGRIRPATDLSGRHVLHLGTSGSLLGLATRLQTAGCPVTLTSQEIANDQAFADLAAQRRQPLSEPSGPGSGSLPRGTRLSLAEVAPSPAELSARLIDRGSNNHLLEVRNRGGVPLTGVRWELPPKAQNWAFFADVLPEYPIARLEPREHIRVPAAISMGGPAVIRVDFVGTDPVGTEYRTTVQLSVYD